jgi:hypothetical protein
LWSMKYSWAFLSDVHFGSKADVRPITEQVLLDQDPADVK